MIESNVTNATNIFLVVIRIEIIVVYIIMTVETAFLSPAVESSLAFAVESSLAVKSSLAVLTVEAPLAAFTVETALAVESSLALVIVVIIVTATRTLGLCCGQFVAVELE